MKIKLLLITILLFFVISPMHLQANEGIASLYAKEAPLVRQTKASQKEKTHNKRLKKEKERNQQKKTQDGPLRKPGFIAMIIGGVLVMGGGAALALGRSAFGCLSRGALILGVFFLVGGLVLLVLGIIFLAKYNSEKYLNKNTEPIKKDLPNISTKDAQRAAKIEAKIANMKKEIKIYQKRNGARARRIIAEREAEIWQLEKELEEIEARSEY